MTWRLRRNAVSFERTVVMGVLNLTPDSFSDGGKYLTPEAACEQAVKLVGDGADILDLGAESTRPGARPVRSQEELERLLPALALIRKKLTVPLSIDTTKPDVAEKCLEAGADIINDVSGLKRSGADLARVVKEFNAGLILMHSRGTPETMQELAEYQDVVEEVLTELRESVQLAIAAGVERERIAVDPGLGFAKNTAQNLEIMRNLRAFQAPGFPVVLGPSRKSFIGQLTGRTVREREFGTAACVAEAVRQGIQVLRVHEPGAARDVVLVTEAVKQRTNSK